MKIRAQIAKVLNLDKCIGCHTCSVTCKNVWTSREGIEYAWFNNVETKPGIGYPKDWENQKRWNGGWERKSQRQHLQPKQGGEVAHAREHLRQPRPAGDRRLLRALHLRLRAPAIAPRRCRRMPTARPRSLITGERMEKIEWGPNWEEILGGEFAKRQQGLQLRGRRRRRSTASSRTPS